MVNPMTDTDHTRVRAFIADWFARFDRLAPIDAFLPNLHPQVDWDMWPAAGFKDGNLSFHSSSLDLYRLPDNRSNVSGCGSIA
jgi:hypothetical protein